MSEHRQALVLAPKLPLNLKMRLARIAAGLDLDSVAAELEVSRRTYERVEAGERAPTRDELAAFAELTNQNVSLFDTSAAARGGAVLSRAPRRNQPGRRRVA